MSLVKYAQKRDFKKTAEPKAGRSKDKAHLMFVIQKHDASSVKKLGCTKRPINRPKN